ncbi:MAG TPA: hypothetical protein VF796_00915 [Humisphaera sp.]
MRTTLKVSAGAAVVISGFGLFAHAQVPGQRPLPNDLPAARPVRPGDGAKPPEPKLLPDAQPAAGGLPAGQPEQQPLALPAGVTAKQLNEQGDVRNAFEAVTEAAFDTGDTFDKITARLVDADRTRVGKWKDTKPDMTSLRTRVEQLNKLWQAKYGKKFDLDEKVVFGAPGVLAIAEGEVSDPAQVVKNWPVPASAATAAMAAGKVKPDATPKAVEAGKVAGGDVNLDKGRNVAVARLPESHGMPAVTASLIHELPDVWRFDLPDTMDGQKLHDNLLKHLNMLGDGSQWPADVNDAYRAVAHHVLMAMYDVDAPAAPGAGQRAQ